MNLRISVIGLIGVAALFVATGSFGASARPPTGAPTVIVQAAPPAAGESVFPTLTFAPKTLTMAMLASMAQTTVTIDGGATTEKGPLLTVVLGAAGFTPLANNVCKNDSTHYWTEAASLNGSAATVVNGEIDPKFGQNTTILSLTQNGTALTAPRLVVSKDATDARDIPAVFDITVGRAPTIFSSTKSMPGCLPTTFTAMTPPSTLGPVIVSGDVSSPSTWGFDQLGNSALFTQVSQTDSINGTPRPEIGPALFDVVSANGPIFPSGPDSHARGFVQAISSEDGAFALVSWAEVDPSLSGAAVSSSCACKLLSLNEDGHSVLPPLPGQDNGPRLTVPGDNMAGRYNFGVQFVQYLNAPNIPLPAAGSGPNLAGANVKDTPLVNAYLVGANLEGTNLNKNDLSGAFLTNADLTGANLNKANLSNAILTGANLSGANLNGVTWSNTTCPDGTNSNDDGGSCAGHI